MILFVFSVSFLVAFVIAGHCKLSSAESSRYLVDAEWLDQSDKFKLIARWGIK